MNTDQPVILVTGSAGLVGSELVRQLLDSGQKVKAIYNKTPISFNHPNLLPVHCDLLDTESLYDHMQGIQFVYHCAAVVSFSRKMKSELYKVNITGTANVVNACIDAGIKKLI